MFLLPENLSRLILDIEYPGSMLSFFLYSTFCLFFVALILYRNFVQIIFSVYWILYLCHNIVNSGDLSCSLMLLFSTFYLFTVIYCDAITLFFLMHYLFFLRMQTIKIKTFSNCLLSQYLFFYSSLSPFLFLIVSFNWSTSFKYILKFEKWKWMQN